MNVYRVRKAFVKLKLTVEKILQSETRENLEIKLGGEYADFKTFREISC